MIWNEPFFQGNSKGWVNQVAGGWSVAPIFTARSGVPFTISDIASERSVFRLPSASSCSHKVNRIRD
jgi:hypothetical protein